MDFLYYEQDALWEGFSAFISRWSEQHFNSICMDFPNPYNSNSCLLYKESKGSEKPTFSQQPSTAFNDFVQRCPKNLVKYALDHLIQSYVVGHGIKRSVYTVQVQLDLGS